MNSVRNKLALVFFVITAAAVGFVYLYVVPQLRSSLTAERLRQLEQAASDNDDRLAKALSSNASQTRLRGLLGAIDQRTGARVTVLGVRPGSVGPEPAFVVADSQSERTAVEPGYPAAAAAVLSGAPTSAVEPGGSGQLGEAALPLGDGEPNLVAVFSTELGDVDENVALIRRQILIAGAIALLAALGAGYLVAGAHARRLRRLERAAEKVADGDFSSPIGVDSTDEVGQLAITFNEMQKRLAVLDDARKEFIANASHELRTPIFSLAGFVELLGDEDPEPEVRAEFIREMRGQVERLTKLTVDLLDLSKIDADAIELRREPVRLAEAARRVVAEFAPAAERHRSPITVVESAPAAVMADPDRVAQIMRILIDNALTHTPEGTAIKVGTRTATDDRSASLVVTDDGPGVERHSRESVFERFYTGDESSGSGLGLAIARELAQRMDGSLVLRRHRGSTELELSLPVAATVSG